MNSIYTDQNSTIIQCYYVLADVTDMQHADQVKVQKVPIMQSKHITVGFLIYPALLADS
jgi:hypothetical protein